LQKLREQKRDYAAAIVIVGWSMPSRSAEIRRQIDMTRWDAITKTLLDISTPHP